MRMQLQRTRSLLRYLALSVIAALLSVPSAFAQATIPISEARNQPLGTTVTIEGTVTRAFGAYIRVQDESGATGASGIVVRQTFGDLSDDVQSDIADGTITQGTKIRLTGSTSEFNGLVQINNTDLESYQVQGQGAAPPPQSVTLEDLATNGEDYESELVSVSGIRFPSASGTFSFDQSYTVSDGAGTLDLRVPLENETQLGGAPIPGIAVDYEGVVGQFNATYQLVPVLTSDVPVPAFALSRNFADAEEGEGSVIVTVRAMNLPDGETGTVTATVGDGSTAELGSDVTGFSNPQTLQFMGPNPAPQTVRFDVVDDTDREGLERLEVDFSSPDGLDGSGTYTLWIRDDPTAQGPIAEDLSGVALTQRLRDTYGGAPTLEYENSGAARDTLFAAVYEARGDSLRGVYTGFARFLPEGADPTEAACDFDEQACFDADDLNTEHAWPQDRGASQMPAQGDMHILFPARGDVVQARNDYPYGDIPEADTEEWFFRDLTQTEPPAAPDRWSRVDVAGTSIESRFEPRDGVKGDIARAVFYFVTMYPDQVDLLFYEAQRQTLFRWHRNDPVDAPEMRRNIIKATYQGNKVNPFIIDPTLIGRAYFGGVRPPTGIVAASSDTTVDLQWTEPSDASVAGYNVYRSTEAFSAPADAQRLNPEGIVPTTSFTDTDVQVGGAYVYRITGVDANGTESDLSAAAEAVVYPDALDVTVDRAFGDMSQSSSYRLVALPGDVDAPVGETLGNPSTDWTALWDDGSDRDFLVRFDGSDTFRFRPGRGFWLLSETNWTFDASIRTVPLTGDTVTIPLHDGWNIISNPLPVDLAWAEVSAANGGSLQPIWAWDGSFQQTAQFGTALDGDAYYFLNDTGRTELTVPLSAAILSSDKAEANTAPAHDTGQTVTVTATAGGASGRVVVGHHANASAGLDASDVVAPPTAFAVTALRSQAPADPDDAHPRRQYLARDLRAPSRDGHRYTLSLTAPSGEPVTVATDLATSRPDAHSVLIDAATGARHSLDDGSTTIRPDTETSTWHLRLGTKAFVEAADEHTPADVVVEKPAPNPFRTTTTMRYTLPEAMDVSVQVYDLLGRRIGTLVDKRQTSGRHTLRWNGTASSGGGIASGMYFVRMTLGDRRVVHKVAYVR